MIGIAVAVVAGLPVVITVIQAAQGGFSAAKTAFTASATPTLFLHTIELAALATPALRRARAGDGLVRRAHAAARPSALGAAARGPADRAAVRHQLRLGDAGTSLHRVPRGAAGIVAFSYYPIVFLLVAASLRGMDPALEETRALARPRARAARSCASSCRSCARRSWAACCWSLLDTLVEFDAFVALKFQTFSSNIYAQYQLGFSASGAAALSLFSIAALRASLLFGEARLRGQRQLHARQPGRAAGAVRYGLGRRALPVALSASR